MYGQTTNRNQTSNSSLTYVNTYSSTTPSQFLAEYGLERNNNLYHPNRSIDECYSKE